MPTWLSNGHYLTLGLLLACTTIGIIVAARFQREVNEDLAPTTPGDLLDPLEEAYHSGLIHPDEMERVRESVKNAAVPTAPVPPPARGKQPASGRSDLMQAGDASPATGSLHLLDDAGSDASGSRS